jgi:hypothetical protein
VELTLLCTLYSIEWQNGYSRLINDLLPENNATLEVIPQIITNDADEFLFVSKYVQELGYMS